MNTETIIVTGIVVAVVSAIAISFFRTKPTPEVTQEGPTVLELLDQLKSDLNSIKQTLEDRVEK